MGSCSREVTPQDRGPPEVHPWREGDFRGHLAPSSRQDRQVDASIPKIPGSHSSQPQFPHYSQSCSCNVHALLQSENCSLSCQHPWTPKSQGHPEDTRKAFAGKHPPCRLGQCLPLNQMLLEPHLEEGWGLGVSPSAPVRGYNTQTHRCPRGPAPRAVQGKWACQKQ